MLGVEDRTRTAITLVALGLAALVAASPALSEEKSVDEEILRPGIVSQVHENRRPVDPCLRDARGVAD